MPKLVFSSTQGKYLDLLLDIFEHSKQKVNICSVVSDSSINQGKYLNFENIRLIKEWEIYETSVLEDDYSIVSKFEKDELGQSLFKALVIDRRMYFGSKTKVRQSYKPRFTNEELEAKLIKMTATLIREFDNKKPDLCILFSMTNVQDYIIYSLCKARKIKFLQIRSAKIENYVIALDDFFELPKNIQYDTPEETLKIARTYIKKVQDEVAVSYEGALLKKRFSLKTAIKRIGAGVKADVKRYFDPVQKQDNHVEWLCRNNFYTEILNPIRWSRQKKFFSKQSKSKRPYFLYPLHFEPEVAIQFYGTPYLNQIELIRNIAMSLPIGTELMIKEHPRSYGVRSTNYYKKLQKIPRVKFAHHELSMEYLITHSSGVFTISGSSGLEAIIRGKPCWTFGRTYFSNICETMVNYIENINEIDEMIFNLTTNYKYESNEVESFIVRILENSVPFDLYTHYLKKSDRYKTGNVELSVKEIFKLINRALE